jgi:hypothetical protein
MEKNNDSIYSLNKIQNKIVNDSSSKIETIVMSLENDKFNM